MSESTNKMQLRGQVISLLSKYQKVRDVCSEEIKKDITFLKEIKNNDFVVKLLLDEISEKNREFNNICALFLIQIASQDSLEKHSLSILNNKKVADSKKFFIISILKQRGVGIALDDVDNYISSSESLINEQINEFVDNSYSNPEVQIDLMDFFVNIIPQERYALLDSLIHEMQGDKLARVLSLLCYCDLDENELEILIPSLLKTKSLYSTDGFEYLLAKNQNEKFLNKDIHKKIEQEIKKNKLKEKDFIDETLTKNSKIDKCLISLVDGQSTFSLMFSRINKDNSRNCVLLTIDIKKGITSCIGFSQLKLEEFMKILRRVFDSSLPVDINPIALRAIFEFYYNKNFQTNTLLPYEIAVWKKYLNDVRQIDFDLSEFINTKLQYCELNDSKANKVINSKFFENWFYQYGENNKIDEIIDFIEENTKFDLLKTEAKIQKTINDDFIKNEEYLKELKSNLLIQAYVSHLSKFKSTSSAIYGLCFSDKYIEKFIHLIIDRSILQHYLLDEDDEDNLFKKTPRVKLNDEEVSKLIKYFEEKWK